MALCVFERQSRNHLLPLLVSFVPNQLEHLYDRFIDREVFHIDLVRQVALAIALETGSAHDHTKDAFYTFVTCGKYGGVGVDGRPEFESICTDETNRHFSLEPHHPQFEHFRQMECRDCDIQEMAIDRLSRNTVASNGTIDRDTMVRFLPKFELGDVDRKLELYREMVLKLESTVVDEYRKLQITYSQSQGQRPPEVLPDHPGACSDDCLHAKIYILALNKFHIELQPPK